jgi:CDP-diacylglycerol--glycerol-3-phosphate 3-phosphatidyltransferase
MKHFKFSLFAFTLLLSSSVASSFVPFAGRVNTPPRNAFMVDSFCLGMRGGADNKEAGSPVPNQTSAELGSEKSVEQEPLVDLGAQTVAEEGSQAVAEKGSQAVAEQGIETVVEQVSQPVVEQVSQTVVEQGGKALLGPNATPPGALRKTVPGFPWHKLPNWLTYIRCLAIPALVAIFYLPNRHVETSTLFAVASFTDWLDGYLARRWDITSAFGAFLDPVADKLMVSTALILLSGRFGMHVVIPACIILAREISVSALREWMAQRGLRDIVKVGFQGKLKTALTMLTLTLFLLVPEDGSGPLAAVELPAKVLLYLSAGITLTSGSVYFRAAAPVLMQTE